MNEDTRDKEYISYRIYQPTRINSGAPGRTRTFNLGIKSPLLCQIELRAHPNIM